VSGKPVELGERLQFVVTATVTELADVPERRALLHPGALHHRAPFADYLWRRVLDLVEDRPLVAGVLESDRDRRKYPDIDIELLFEPNYERLQSLDGGPPLCTRLDRNDQRSGGVNGVVQVRTLRRWRVADQHVVLLRDVSLPENAEQLRVHPEGLAHRLGLLFLTLEVLPQIREHIMFRDNIDPLDRPD
jgi:hypothetical protein